MSTTTSILQQSLEKHNATFETLLNLIPAKYYLAQELSEEQVYGIPHGTSCFILNTSKR